MQVRVVRAAGAVRVGGGDEATRVLADDPGLAAAGDAGLVFEVGERCLPGRLVSLADCEAMVVVAEGVQQADALGSSEDEVEPGDGSKLPLVGAPLAGLSVDPLDGDRSCLGVFAKPLATGGIDPEISLPRSPSATTPTRSSPLEPRPAHTPGDSPRPA